MVAPNICEGSVGNVLHVTLLVPRILIWLSDILKKMCTSALWHSTSLAKLYFFILLQEVVVAWWMHELVSLA